MKQTDTEAFLAEIDVLLREGIDLSSSDPDAMLRVVQPLCAAASYLNQWLLEEYGGHPGADRGPELLEQIVAAPFQTFGGEELHPDPFEKAAMLWRGITQGHPFGDGNKRAGFALASYYLRLMGFDPPVDAWEEEELYAVNIRISAGEIRDIGELQQQLWEWWGVIEEDATDEDT